ncbi:MAG: DUF6276 family protein [Halalkalicoccus sp.]
MQCPECGGDTLAVAVPDDLREYLPSDPTTAAICRRCLTTTPYEGSVTDDLAAVVEFSTRLPDDPETALALALLVTLCDSLALYRSEIEALVARIERAGVDPLSTLAYLEGDPGLDLALDVERRRHQLVQLLE